MLTFSKVKYHTNINRNNTNITVVSHTNITEIGKYALVFQIVLVKLIKD